MDYIEEDAIRYFRSDNNCAQAVLKAFADDIGIDIDLAENIISGFGAGTAYQQKTCGAVSAAYMVLNMLASKKNLDNSDKKELAYKLIQEFNDEFTRRNGSIDCSQLLNCKLSTDEGQKYIEEHNLFEVVCEKCIRESVKILSDVGD